MLVWLLSTFVCINAASLAATPAPQACSQQGLKIALTPSGYSLPLTSYGDAVNCTYHFTNPQGYFAYVNLKAYQLQWREQVFIKDFFGITVANNDSQKGHSNYSSVQSWPVGFEVVIQTSTMFPSVAQMSLDIQVLPETPNANIVKSYVTFAGSSSVFINSNEWNDGESYKFTSKSGQLYVIGAADPDVSIETDDNWNNVFIYEGGRFRETLAALVQPPFRQRYYVSTSHEIILYCTKKVNVTGAVMVTDYSNVKGVEHLMEYVPQDTHSFYIELDSIERESAFTIVSDRKSPQMLQVTEIDQILGSGTVSYIAGGPIQNHSNSIKVTQTPPTNATSYANTFYLDKGTQVVWFKM